MDRKVIRRQESSSAIYLKKEEWRRKVLVCFRATFKKLRWVEALHSNPIVFLRMLNLEL